MTKGISKWLYFNLYIIEVILAAPLKLHVSNGNNATLKCKNNPGNDVIQWLRLNPDHNVTDNTYTDGWTINKNLKIWKRIRIEGSVDSGTYNLQIFNVTREDSAKYRCAFIDGATVKSLEVELIVDAIENVTKYQKAFSNRVIFQTSGAACGFLVILVCATLIFLYVQRGKSKHPISNHGDNYQDHFWSTPQVEMAEYGSEQFSGPNFEIRHNEYAVSNILQDNLGNTHALENHTESSVNSSRIQEDSDQNMTDNATASCHVNKNSNTGQAGGVPETEVSHIYDQCTTIAEYQSLVRNQRNEPHFYH